MVIMHGRMPCKMGMLAVGPYRFIRYINNLGLVAEVEDKVGIVQKVSSSHLLPCLSTPEQVKIDELPVDIIEQRCGRALNGQSIANQAS